MDCKNQVNLTKTFLIVEEQVPSIRNFPDYLLCYSILVGLIGSKLIKVKMKRKFKSSTQLEIASSLLLLQLSLLFSKLGKLHSFGNRNLMLGTETYLTSSLVNYPAPVILLNHDCLCKVRHPPCCVLTAVLMGEENPT